MMFVGICDGENTKVFRLEQPFDLSKVVEVPSKKEEERRMNDIEQLTHELANFFIELFNDSKKSQKKCEKNQNCSCDTESRKIKVNYCNCEQRQKLVKKLTGQIARENSIDSKNISKAIKKFNSKFGAQIECPKKVGDGYTASVNTWKEFERFVSKK